MGLNLHVWQPQIDYFSADYRIVVYDLLGHGSSTLPPEEVTLAHYTAQLGELLDHIDIDSINLIGHSMGAIIGVAFALEFPGMVTSLIPINIVYKRNYEQQEGVLARANQVLEEGQVRGFEEALNRWFFDKNDSQSLKKIELIRRSIQQVNATGYGRTYRLFAESDSVFVGKLNQLTNPTLYLTGENDTNSTPEMSQMMADECANAQAIVIEGEAHMMAYISAEKVNPVIGDFIRSVEMDND